jgi:hypothetical protein
VLPEHSIIVRVYQICEAIHLNSNQTDVRQCAPIRYFHCCLRSNQIKVSSVCQSPWWWMRPNRGHVGNLVPPQSHEAASRIVKAIAVKKVLMDYQKWSAHREIRPMLTSQNHVLVTWRGIYCSRERSNFGIWHYVKMIWNYKYFRMTYCLHFQGRGRIAHSILRMEATGFLAKR